MNIEKVSEEFAKDWIELVNSLKGFKYNAHVNYKTKSGQTTKFDYITLDKIYDEAKKNNNFAITEPLGTDEQGESALQVLVIHKSGEIIKSGWYKLRVPNNASKQDEGSAITYTKRYALGSFLGISTDQDNDANPDGDGMQIKPEEQELASKKQIEDITKLAGERLNLILKAEETTLEEMTDDKAKDIISKLEIALNKGGK